MSTDFAPPGDHPTDVMLLLLSDMTDESMVRDLVADLENDPRPDDKFSPSFVLSAWAHLQQCSVCEARRGMLIGRVPAALVSVSAEDSWVVSGLDQRVRHAAQALVASPGHEPSVSPAVSSRNAERGRLFRSGTSLGTGGTGILARRWTLASAVAALVIGGGIVVGFRPSATQKGAIRAPITTTVASLDRSAADATAESAAAAETTSGASSVFADNALPATAVTGTAESKAVVGGAVAQTNDAAKADNADEENPSTRLPDAMGEQDPPSAGLPAPSGTHVAPPPPSVVTAPRPAAPSASSSLATSAPKRTRTTASPARATPTRRTAKKASTAPSPASADTAAGTGAPAAAARSVPRSGVDLGEFLTVNDALDRFAAMVVTASDASTVGPATNAAGQGQSTPATASPAPAAPSAGDLGTAKSCPAIVGDRRATATVAGRPVVIVQTTEATAATVGNDVVVDAITCAIIGQRLSAATVFAPPATGPAPSLPR